MPTVAAPAIADELSSRECEVAIAPTRSQTDMTRTARALILCCYGLIGAAWPFRSKDGGDRDAREETRGRGPRG